ncbi:MAG: hypothetical protein FJ354_00655 [Thaumarchaeota archaeon]|nr:hypothetical protein [Nitrososphaerota archaeon]
MAAKKLEEICNKISAISPYVRFVGIINTTGELLAYKMREGMTPLLDSTATKNQFAHIAIKTDMEAKFDKSLGEVQFVWEERRRIQTISFAVGKHRVWVSIDKKVIRTEMLRIIDSCLPIVKNYS